MLRSLRPVGPNESDAERKHRLRWWTLGALSLSLMIIGLDNTILNVAIPTLQQELDASASELQWMVDSYILVFAGLLLTLGALGDRFGRARALQVGLLIFGGSSLVAAYVDSPGHLIAARAVMGIGGAFIMPATLSILSDVFPREERGKAIAIWAGVSGVGIGLGPLAGGLLLDSFSWGSVFLVNVPIVVGALVLGRWLVPESRDPGAPRLDVPGAVLSMGAISALVYAIIEAPAAGWGAPETLIGFAVAVVLGITFALWERHADHPMLDLSFFRNRRFSIGASAIALTFFALFGSIFSLTQYLQFVRDYSPLEAGVRLTPIALGIMIGAGRSHHLVERLGTTRVVTGAMVGIALVLGSLSLWTSETPYWIVGTTMFLLALSMGNVMAPTTDAVMGAIPEEKAGVGSAMNDVTRQVAGAFGVAIVGSIVNTVYADQMRDQTVGLPPEAARPSEDSIGAALAVAGRIGGPVGDALAAAAQNAFVDAFGVAVLVAASVALAGAALVARYLPAHHLAPATSEHRPTTPVRATDRTASRSPSARHSAGD
jgi:EmrB/QacA subfamily drug resistance transporter